MITLSIDTDNQLIAFFDLKTISIYSILKKSCYQIITKNEIYNLLCRKEYYNLVIFLSKHRIDITLDTIFQRVLKKIDQLITVGAIKGDILIIQYVHQFIKSDVVYQKTFHKQLASGGRVDALKYLVENEIRMDLDDMLTTACDNNQNETAEYLVNIGANINSSNYYPITMAVTNGNLELVRFLILHGANIDSCGHDLIAISIITGNIPLTKYMIDYISSHNVYSATGTSIGSIFSILGKSGALELALQHGYLEIVQFLMEEYNVYFDIDVDDRFLILAFKKRSPFMIKYFLSRGGNIHVRDDRPLHIACSCGYLDVVQCLFETLQIKFTYLNILLAINTAKINNHLDIVEYLKLHNQ